MRMQFKRLIDLGAMLSLSILLLLLAAGEASHAQDAGDPVWPTKAWLTSTAEAQGMDSAALAQLVAYGESHRFDSLLVIRHGRIVTEAYYAPYAGDVPHEIFSSTKAITGTLLGIVYKDGGLDRLDHRMLDFFPNRRIANVDDRKRAVTVQNLLDMTSGLDWDQGFLGGQQQTQQDMNRASNMIQFILDRPMAHQPGEVFNYSDGNPNLISAIITTLTGKPAEDYAREKLFTPLGIVDWHWDRDPQELTIGNGMLFLLPRDMAKIGYLYLHHGQWEGAQLLPPGWADILNHSLVNMHAPNDPSLSYSNYFWVFPDKRVFMANGKDGQLIVVFPDLDIVVVTTARKQVRYGALIDAVSGAVKSDSALPPNPGAVEQLSSAINDATVEKPTPVGPTPEIASAISGKRYTFPDNILGLRSLTLFLTGPRPHFEYEQYLSFPAGTSVTYDMPIGLDGFYRRGSPALFGHYPGHIPAAKGSWKDGSTFVIDTQDIGYGTQLEHVLSFNGKKLNFRRIDEEGWEVSVDGEQGD
jgi:CubicO group peptidase (beta-lactamase class C family)